MSSSDTCPLPQTPLNPQSPLHHIALAACCRDSESPSVVQALWKERWSYKVRLRHARTDESHQTEWIEPSGVTYGTPPQLIPACWGVECINLACVTANFECLFFDLPSPQPQYVMLECCRILLLTFSAFYQNDEITKGHVWRIQSYMRT